MNRKLFAAFLILTTLGFSGTALAVQYDIKERTPEIDQAFNGRKARYQQIKQYTESGGLHEGNDGLVQVSKPIPGLAEIAAAENADRMTIYTAIATQNNLGPGGLAQVQKAFAEVRREKGNS